MPIILGMLTGACLIVSAVWRYKAENEIRKTLPRAFDELTLRVALGYYASAPDATNDAWRYYANSVVWGCLGLACIGLFLLLCDGQALGAAAFGAVAAFALAHLAWKSRLRR